MSQSLAQLLSALCDIDFERVRGKLLGVIIIIEVSYKKRM